LKQLSLSTQEVSLIPHMHLIANQYFFIRKLTTVRFLEILECFWYNETRAFRNYEHIGGVPTAIWFDNMSTIVKKIKEYGERDLTKGFLRFMMHYGFQSNICNPNSGHEKGSVENKVGYHRRNMLVPIPEFMDLRGYNKELLLKCDQDMNRMHYKGYGMIKDLIQAVGNEYLQ